MIEQMDERTKQENRDESEGGPEAEAHSLLELKPLGIDYTLTVDALF